MTVPPLVVSFGYCHVDARTGAKFFSTDTAGYYEGTSRQAFGLQLASGGPVIPFTLEAGGAGTTIVSVDPSLAAQIGYPGGLVSDKQSWDTAIIAAVAATFPLGIASISAPFEILEPAA